MSDEEYIPAFDTEEVWGQTSKWTEYQKEQLKIQFVNGSITDITLFDISTIALPEDSNRILLPQVNIGLGDPIPNLTKSERKFYNRVLQVQEFSDEPPVDSIARDLLDYTDFESDSIHFRPRPLLKYGWKTHIIASEPDFGVYSDRSRGGVSNEYLLLVEDKRPKASFINAEYQLAGELFVAACNRADFQMKQQEIYGIVIRGKFVRFYKCEFSELYLRNILRNKHQNEVCRIYRFPPDTEEPLSISTYKHREKIIRTLCCIRQRIDELLT